MNTNDTKVDVLAVISATPHRGAWWRSYWLREARYVRRCAHDLLRNGHKEFAKRYLRDARQFVALARETAA